MCCVGERGACGRVVTCQVCVKDAMWRMELVLGTLFTLVQDLSQPLELALRAVGMWEGHFPAHSPLSLGETLEAGVGMGSSLWMG